LRTLQQLQRGKVNEEVCVRTPSSTVERSVATPRFHHRGAAAACAQLTRLFSAFPVTCE